MEKPIKRRVFMNDKITKNKEIRNPKIDRIESTEETITGRGGLALFVRYLSRIGIYPYLERGFGGMRKSGKGIPVCGIFKQLLCFFMDGTSFSIARFEELKEDKEYVAVIENREEDMASSHSIYRFFKAFSFVRIRVFRRLLQKLFIWRLKVESPDVIILGLDTMVMDNDNACKRQGVSPTYKNVKGFQPLQLSWNNYIIDAVFRSGKRHSNHKDTVVKMVKYIVKRIRKEYKEDIPILLRCDAGFFDKENFKAFEELKILYICGGRIYKDIKALVEEAEKNRGLKEYRNDEQIWDWFEFMDKRGKWDTARRAIYTKSRTEEDGQMVFNCARTERVMYTNIGINKKLTKRFEKEKDINIRDAEEIIEIYHQRGKDELVHRGLKDFGTEQLPFQDFTPNSAFYWTMLLSFFLYEAFKRDVGEGIIKINSYATTFRRRLIDFAAKIVQTGREIIMKVTETVWKGIRIKALWERCNSPPVIS